MDTSEHIRIEPLRTEHVDAVVSIHRAELGYTLNSRLGAEHLGFLYETMRSDPDCYVGTATASGKPVGVISGTLDARRLKSRLLRSMAVRQIFEIAVALLFHPSMTAQWITESIIGAPLRYRGASVSAVLTTLAVEAKFQGRGFGRNLVNALEIFFATRDVHAYRLETLVGNDSARRFYGSLGFDELGKRAGSFVLVKGIGK